jgi:transposase
MNAPKRIDITPEQLDALLQRVKDNRLLDNDYEIIKAMADTVSYLSQLSEEKAGTIKKLLKMLFGDQSEKAEKILNKPRQRQEDKNNEEKKKPEGHGRNGASDYTGAKKVKVPHETLKHGSRCPECQKGKVYRDNKPATAVRVTGKAPLQATVYQMERLRCNLCGEIFTAKTPDEIGDEKYDAASAAMIGLLKYGSGLPFNRLQQLPAGLGVPLAASTQWEIVDDAANKVFWAWQELVRQAAQGSVVYNDDTNAKILSLIKENKDGNSSSSKKGMFTSAILSEVGDKKIALFFTGRNHAGDNLADVLSKRQAGLDPPIQMCDALSRNLSDEFKTVLANCLVHARRNFVDVLANFPKRCQHVIETLADVYENDRVTKVENMTDQQRLEYHQTHSEPLMKKLEEWLDAQLQEKRTEPNSGLGKAIAYMQNHWEALTLFLKVPGAPLDNNLCEQVLKRAILHRKNSLFFKTERGAFVGDLFMSLIHTCSLVKANPFEYLTALQEYHRLVRKNPRDWMPWNYTEALPESDQ